MSQINTHNMALTAKESALLRVIYTNKNCVDIGVIKAEAKRQEMAPKELDLALAMLTAQGFIHKQARIGVAGGNVYAIALKAMKLLRAQGAAQREATKASDRQPALMKV